MAIIRKAFSAYHTSIPTRDAAQLIQWSLDARRATILFRRIKNVSEDADVKIFGTFSPDTSDHSEITPYRDTLTEKRGEQVYGEGSPNTIEHSNFVTNALTERGFHQLEDFVAIIDLDASGPDKDYEIIKLPFIPKEIEYNSESSFAAIKAMGSNNARYHFTGAEDKVEFEIDWYAFDWGRREVIEKCRKIESLTKADGYRGGPHRVKLMWGRENVLFAEHEFIVLSAPYRLSHFNKGVITPDGQLQSTHLFPIQAYQKVTLARITSKNLRKVDIEFVAVASDSSI